jgi:hypothetical protein
VAAAGRWSVLVVTGLAAKEVADFIVLAAEAFGLTMLFAERAYIGSVL